MMTQDSDDGTSDSNVIDRWLDSLLLEMVIAWYL